MPLYTDNRDAGFLLGINKELLHQITSTEVGIFKMDLEQNEANIYGESEKKIYHPQVRLYSWIMDEGKSSIDSEFGIDYTKTMQFRFLRDDLETANVFLSEGDIIYYDKGFYEVKQVSSTNYWSGRNPETSIGVEQSGFRKTGYNHSIIANSVLSRTNSLHIVEDVRKGIIKTITRDSISKNE